MQEIDHKLAFNWWVKHVLNKRDRKITSIRKQQARYSKKSNTFCIELSKMVEQALALDDGNTSWVDTISREMENFRVAFKVLPGGKSEPIGHQFV